MFVQVYVVQLSSELGEARGCWGGEGGGGDVLVQARGGAKQACPCLSDKLGQARGGAKQACPSLSDKLVYACLTSLFMLV